MSTQKEKDEDYALKCSALGQAIADLYAAGRKANYADSAILQDVEDALCDHGEKATIEIR